MNQFVISFDGTGYAVFVNGTVWVDDAITIGWRTGEIADLHISATAL